MLWVKRIWMHCISCFYNKMKKKNKYSSSSNGNGNRIDSNQNTINVNEVNNKRNVISII